MRRDPYLPLRPGIRAKAARERAPPSFRRRPRRRARWERSSGADLDGRAHIDGLRLRGDQVNVDRESAERGRPGIDPTAHGLDQPLSDAQPDTRPAARRANAGNAIELLE